MSRMMCMDWNLPVEVNLRMGMSTGIGVMLCIDLGTHTAGDIDGRTCYRRHSANLA